MRVTFVLPCSGRGPSGGFRIIYEHANRLAQKGHVITLVHMSASKKRLRLNEWPRTVVRFIRDKLRRTYRPQGWFTLNPAIRTQLILRPISSALPDGDAVVATAWETAEMVANAPLRTGRRFYFVQSYEDWSGPADLVRATWAMPMEKIVIAQWLEDIADQMGEPSVFVPNAIDHSFFARRLHPSERNPRSLLFQSMDRELKGSAEAVAAIQALRAQGLHPEVLAFGRVDPGHFGLREPYEFYQNPSQDKLVELYNRAAIYITPSHVEGWSLTLAEAAACGAALVASDIGGHTDLAFDRRNALLFPVKDVDGLSHALITLLEDNDLRVRLAEQACRDVAAFTWDVASDRFERILVRGPSAVRKLTSKMLIGEKQSSPVV